MFSRRLGTEHARIRFLSVLLLMLGPVVRVPADDTDTMLEDRRGLLNAVRTDGEDAIDRLIDALDDERPDIRLTAAHLIAQFSDAASDVYEAALACPDPDVRYVILRVLERSDRLKPYVTDVLTDEDPRIRRMFHLRFLPDHFLEDGTLPDDLVAIFDRLYTEGTDEVRREIIRTVSGLPLTDASAKLLARARQADDSAIARKARRAVVESKLARLEQLSKAKDYKKFLVAFDSELGNEDLDAWAEESAYKVFYLRSQVYRALKQPDKALEDLTTAIGYRPDRRAYRDMGFIYRDDLKDPERALAAFRKALETRVGSGGHVLYRSILGAAGILRSMDRPAEALEVLDRKQRAIEDMGTYWGPSFLRAYATTLAAKGDYEAAIGCYERMAAWEELGKEKRESAREAAEDLRRKRADSK